MSFSKDPILFEDLRIGMRVQDSDGCVSIIKNINDINNVLVEYENGNGGFYFYCLNPKQKGCENLYLEERDLNSENRNIIICKYCNEVVYIYKDAQLCPKCKNLIVNENIK